jgi:hypothetical protein
MKAIGSMFIQEQTVVADFPPATCVVNFGKEPRREIQKCGFGEVGVVPLSVPIEQGIQVDLCLTGCWSGLGVLIRTTLVDDDRSENQQKGNADFGVLEADSQNPEDDFKIDLPSGTGVGAAVGVRPTSGGIASA